METECMDEWFKIITPGEPVDQCYGLTTIELEPEHIKALVEGKQIYTTINCAEYAIILTMSGPKINDETERSDKE